MNELVLDQGAVLYQRGRDGLDSPPDLWITQRVPDLALEGWCLGFDDRVDSVGLSEDS